MKHVVIIVLFVVAFPITVSAQLFRPLGLGFDGGKYQGDWSQPRMHIESDKLYVCTCQGLYSKDLADKSSAWQLVGFEGIPLQDYARRGSDILALRYNKGGGFLLLSHDGGQTYEDVTPDFLCHEKYEVLACLVQNPTDSNTLLVSSPYHGILRSTDFGQTWEQLIDCFYGNEAAAFIGFHPAHPSIIYNSGENDVLQGHINISYDDGKIWNDHGESLGFRGDNCVHRPAFHPTNPDCWIAGGEGCVFLTDDNGQTWSLLDYYNDRSRAAYWFFSAFDEEHPDTVYLAGCLDENIKLMCSTDGGRSWFQPQQTATNKRPIGLRDLQQYHDCLFLYVETDVYEVSKTELVEQSTSVISFDTSDNENSPIYDLQGRRVAEPQRGIFIQNGRKIFRLNERNTIE